MRVFAVRQSFTFNSSILLLLTANLFIFIWLQTQSYEKFSCKLKEAENAFPAKENESLVTPAPKPSKRPSLPPECANIALHNPFQVRVQEKLPLLEEQNETICPCCGWTGEFKDLISVKIKSTNRHFARCPRCRATESHRITCYRLGVEPLLNFVNGQQLRDGANYPSAFTRRRLLHFDPFQSIAEAIDVIPGLDQIQIDLFKSLKTPNVFKEDITSLRLPDEFIDIAILLQILHRIHDVEQALSELDRVLKPGGVALIEVPLEMHGNETVDCRKMTKNERIKHCGEEERLWKFSSEYFSSLLSSSNRNCTELIVSKSIRNSILRNSYSNTQYLCKKQK